MKNLINTINILILFAITSCAVEEPTLVDPSFTISFQRNGEVQALAGTSFYILPTGSGEFITLFDGTTGHVWGEDGAKGVDFNKADSLAVNYSTAGTYKLTVVATSADKFGKEIIRKSKTVDINVVDNRNSITEFYLNIGGVDKSGSITDNDEIIFNVPDIETDKSYVATFKLSSTAATVRVNGVLQISGTTINDFSQPVVYLVKSLQGSEKAYTVKVNTFPSSSDKTLTKFALGKNDPSIGYTNSNGEIGIIDEVNKTIDLAVNYATVTTQLKLVLESSPYSTIMINGYAYSAAKKNYNIASTVKSIKVVAQNKSEQDYTINLSLQNPVSEFTFAGLIPAPIGVIDPVAKTISVDVLKSTDVSKLTAVWKGSVGAVKIGSILQTNGSTVNDYTTPKVFTFYKGSTAGDSYTVTVNAK